MKKTETIDRTFRIVGKKSGSFILKEIVLEVSVCVCCVISGYMRERCILTDINRGLSETVCQAL